MHGHTRNTQRHTGTDSTQTTHKHKYAVHLHRRAVHRDTQLYKFMQMNAHEQGQTFLDFQELLWSYIFLAKVNIGLVLGD